MNGRSRPPHILIAGGGIGGLTAAIAFGRRGIPATIFERSNVADQTGAGIQLGPNATSVLRDLGVLEHLAERSFRPEGLAIFDGPSGERLTSMPLGAAIEKRYGAPYLTLHRADLQAGLVARSRALRTVALLENKPATGVGSFEDRVLVTSDDGTSREGSWLIGADGLWSEIRQRIAPGALLRYAGATAWRALLPRLSLPAPFDAPIVGIWLGPHAHIVHYPVRGGAALNVVAIIDSGQGQMGWNLEAEPAPLFAKLEGWAKPLRDMMGQATSWRCWSLYRLRGLRTWHEGRIVLMGDAAHPVLPYLAQGAALAIEDAAALAATMEKRPNDLESAFRDFEALRRRRAARVRRAARFYGWAYHWHGALAAARNAAFRRSSPERLLGRFAWLYGPGPRA